MIGFSQLLHYRLCQRGHQIRRLVTFGVAQRSRQGAQLWDMLLAVFLAKDGLEPPDTPYCALAVHPSVIAFDGPTQWLGDFERCVAWTWLTPNPDLRPE